MTNRELIILLVNRDMDANIEIEVRTNNNYAYSSDEAYCVHTVEGKIIICGKE
jgi:hypothetical protein